MAGVIALIAHVGDASNLTRDPDLDKKHLVEVLMNQGPELSEALADARGFGITVAATKSRTPDQSKRLDRDSIVVELLASKMDQTMSKAFQANEALRSSLESHSNLSGDTVLEAMVAMGTLAQQGAETSPAEYFATLTKGVDAIFKMETEVTAVVAGAAERPRREHFVPRCCRRSRGPRSVCWWSPSSVSSRSAI